MKRPGMSFTAILLAVAVLIPPSAVAKIVGPIPDEDANGATASVERGVDPTGQPASAGAEHEKAQSSRRDRCKHLAPPPGGWATRLDVESGFTTTARCVERCRFGLTALARFRAFMIPPGSVSAARLARLVVQSSVRTTGLSVTAPRQFPHPPPWAM